MKLSSRLFLLGAATFAAIAIAQNVMTLSPSQRITIACPTSAQGDGGMPYVAPGRYYIRPVGTAAFVCWDALTDGGCPSGADFLSEPVWLSLPRANQRISCSADAGAASVVFTGTN